MPVRFNPTGSLDIASDPADLPSQAEGKLEVSGAMQRCTNLHLDRAGIAATRRGSAKLNATPIDTTIYRLVEQAGVRYAFAGTQIYRDEVSIETGLTATPWSGILYNSYLTTQQSVFATNGTDRKRVTGSDVQEWGSESPTEPPVLTVGGGYGLTGDYNAKYTWARKEGSTVVWESNPSPPAISPITLGDESLGVTVYAPTDPQITHIRIYRTLTNGSVYYHDQDLAIAPDTTAYSYSYMFDWEQDYLPAGNNYQCFMLDIINNRIITYNWEYDYNSGIPELINDYKYTYPWENNSYNLLRLDTSTADDELGSEAYWIDHDRPPLGATAILGPGFNGVCFALVANNLYYSLPNQPEYWPENYYIEISPPQYPLKGACFLAGSLFVATAIEIYSIQGSSPGTFFPLPLSAQTGTVNPDCFVPVMGYGIFHLGNDGIYQYAGGKDQLITRGQFEPLFRGETRGNVPGLNRAYIANCWMTSYHGKLYFAYPGGSAELPDNMLVMDLATNRTAHHQYPAAFRTATRDDANGRLLAGDTSGYVWAWEDVNLTTDNGAAIAWQLQSKDYNQYYKYFPRYAKYDVQVINGTAAGYILMDDVSKQTHTITGDRNTRKRLVAGCTGDRMAVRVSGSGSVNIYGVEIE